jgi:hypothetical protein
MTNDNRKKKGKIRQLKTGKPQDWYPKKAITHQVQLDAKERQRMRPSGEKRNDQEFVAR